MNFITKYLHSYVVLYKEILAKAKTLSLSPVNIYIYIEGVQKYCKKFVAVNSLTLLTKKYRDV